MSSLGKGGKSIGIGIIVLIIIGVIVAASVQIVDSGHRGVLLHWNAVDVNVPPLDEGLHFVVPFQDQVVNMEVRTLKYVKTASASSKDLQTVSGEITVNYHPAPESVNTQNNYVFSSRGRIFYRSQSIIKIFSSRDSKNKLHVHFSSILLIFKWC